MRQSRSPIGIAVVVAVSITLHAQDPTQKPAAKRSSATSKSIVTSAPSTSPQPAPTSKSTAQASQAGTPSPTVYPADYIPCVFTLPELLGLRLTPVAATLTSADEEELKEQLIFEVTAQANSGGLTPSGKSNFIKAIGNASFVGLTPSQALTKVISILQDIQNEAQQLEQAANDDSVAELITLVELQLPMDGLCTGPPPTPPNTEPAKSDLAIVESNRRRNLADKEKGFERVIQMEANVSAALNGVYFDHPQQFPQAQQTVIGELQDVAKDLGADGPPGGSVGTAGKEQDAQQIAIQSIVDKARSTIKEAFKRPQDVGCAMSILSWQEVHYAFGRLIANEYIGVQVVVRNLNDKQEFSLHDAELSADTDINGSYGRFYSGRDKLIVRGLSLAQADFTPRNIFVHVAEAAGTIMSAALPVAGGAFKDATGVYNGGFLPGLKSSWTDHSVEQLNLLSDIGFSSSTNYKTVVPKSGSVMFVIFIPSKQFEEGWWVQDCAGHISIPAKTGPTPGSSSGPLQLNPVKVGIDLDAARELCRAYGTVAEKATTNAPSSGASQNQPPTPSPGASASQPSARPQGSAGSASQTSAATSATSPPTVLAVERVPYRKWSPTALSIFRELAWAVVAGTHIQETQNESAITQLNCPTNDRGDILFNKTGTLICDITGDGLDKVATLRLRNAQDATDTETADGPVTVSGDATKAKVTFQLSKLGSLNKPVYKVYAVTTTGVEAFANQTIHFDLNPFVTDLSPATADPNKQASMPFALKGFHLDKITKVQLFEGTYKAGATPLLSYDLDSGRTGTQAAFTVKATDDDLKKKAGVGPGEALAVELVVTNSSGTLVDGGSISLKSTLTLSSEAISFDSQTVKTASEAKVVTLTNSGTVALTGFGAKIAGTNSTSFAVTNACKDDDPKCDFKVTFVPASTGKLSATLNITYTVGGSQQSESISLVGTGTGLAATVTLNPKNITFGQQKSGSTSIAKTVTLTNSKAAALTSFGAKISGANASVFKEDNTCGDSVAANAKCSFSLKFAPTGAGNFTAKLRVTYTVGGSQQSESVSMTGMGSQ